MMKPDTWVLAPLTKHLRRQIRESGFINWTTISRNFALPTGLIHRHRDKVDWRYISAYQVLPEGFIHRHRDKVDWRFICRYQDLSAEFILQHLDLVDLEEIAQCYPEVYQQYNLEVYRRLTTQVTRY